ncbi:ATP-binding protein [Streptosporangium sp. NPDC051023]|uniref:ATP-binding protein n=1 Tax=Streptosporangium sp. NPDC051023 TaxID=3155410 RepID=UPI0034504B06
MAVTAQQPRPCVFLEGECREATAGRWATCWARCWAARWDACWDERWNTVHPLGLRAFAGTPSSVPEARGWARELLVGWVRGEALDNVMLLLSEVVTNAVVHSESGRREEGIVTVRLGVGRGLVHVEVLDAGSSASMPAVREVVADSVGGRGLFLVDLLSAGWGARRGETGGAVWFRVRNGRPVRNDALAAH